MRCLSRREITEVPGAVPEARETATLTRGSPRPGWLFPSGVIVRHPCLTVRRRTESPVAGMLDSGVNS
ncbi:hypothetical protein FAIPA1_10337 [Frankia sp. AiPs1]